MRGSFSEWEIEGTGDNASLVEVASLTNLTSLHLDIDNTKWLSTDIGPCHHWEKLENFEINVEKFQIINRTVFKFRRLVSLGTSSDSFPVAAWVNVLMETTYDLFLFWCFGLKNVLQLNPKGRFYNLKTLHISDCYEMEYVVNMEEQVPESMFPNLEILKLGCMNELKAIWNGPLVERSFEKLKVLSISYCGKLVNVLPSLLWTRLQNLEEIGIQYCNKLEKVFEDGPASIFKLRSIKLFGLDSLTSIWEGAAPLIRLENLKVLHVGNCRSLRSRHLFPSVAFAQRFQQLEELEVGSCFIAKLIAEEAEGTEIKSSINFIALPPIFSNLKNLYINKCLGLKCIFPIRILRGLLQLEELKVFNCNEMEELFEFEDGSMTIRLPRLRDLKLWELPRLSSFISHRRRLPRVLHLNDIGDKCVFLFNALPEEKMKALLEKHGLNYG